VLRSELAIGDLVPTIHIYLFHSCHHSDILEPWSSLHKFLRLVGVVWSSRISSSCGGLRIVKELHRQFFHLLRLRDGCGLVDLFGDFPSTTNNVRPTQGGAAAAARHRHSLEVEDEGLLKDLIVIFIFLEVLCTVRCFF
jgi:hypothetical protein